MRYLEDFLDCVEHLPQHLRDRLTDLRELDLIVQNTKDNAGKKMRYLFSKGNSISRVEREAMNSEIKRLLQKAKVDSDEKVKLATTIEEDVKKYLKKLDEELAAFKISLESDEPGITEILEKRSLELDRSPEESNARESSRHGASHSGSRSSSGRNRNRAARSERHRNSNASAAASQEKRATAAAAAAVDASKPSTSSFKNVPRAESRSSPTPSTSYHRPSHIGSLGGNAIAAAASQAIAATQHMQQGRRTASLKASYEAVNSGGVRAPELAGAAKTAIAAVQESTKKVKKIKVIAAKTPRSSLTPSPVSYLQQYAQPQYQQQQTQPQPQQSTSFSSSISPQAPPDLDVHVDVETKNTEWTFDPNEPKYCVCNQISYGEMVACDNSRCPVEWFHYPCVGITESPKGKWFCPECSAAMKRRSARR